MDWTIPDRSITALLGPSATGKSVLLRMLSGLAPLAGWTRHGSWTFRGRPFEKAAGDMARQGEIVWIPQQKSLVRSPKDSQSDSARWRFAFRSGARVLLLDEPSRGASPEWLAELTALLRDHMSGGAAVVVTHDLSFARLIADEVCLVCAGKIEAAGEARQFFQSPPTPLCARFVQQGNCWPGPSPVLDLPSHFHWILPDQLAGMGRPGLLRDVDEDLASIAAAGISLLLSLTADPVPRSWLRPFGIEGRHYPIPDMGAPSIGDTALLCRTVEKAIRAGKKVAVHCHAGLGRTGTILAALLVWFGWDSQMAVERVRSEIRGAIQTEGQLSFVSRFAESKAKTTT
jgi:atypical dual specificity phosphatase